MKIYAGKRIEDDVKVVVQETATGEVRELEHHVKHSPTGFEWDYEGSGPADLARSILWDFMGKEPLPDLYQEFKRDFVAEFKIDKWMVDGSQIEYWFRIKGLNYG